MHKVQPMGTAEWTFLLLLSLLWGGSFLFAGLAVREMGPLTVVLGRVAIAGLALLVATKLRGSKVVERPRDVFDYVVMAVLNNVIPFSLLFWALQHIGPGLAAIFNATTPFFAVIFAQILTDDEKINTGKVMGVVIGISGVATLIGAKALHGVGDELLPSLACVGAAIAYAVSSIWARRFRSKPLTVPATGQLLSATVILVPIVVAVERPWLGDVPSGVAIGALLALALASTALAYLLYFRILRTAGATNLTLVTLLIPASASVLGALFLDEALGPEAFVGMALIALGIAATDGRPAAWLGRRAA
ncbi:DMT family transporter [Lutibaculum baratangense]|uniref:Permease of the drug/metabolite transporter (DMT) superfamily n=1 Tax=Lutibaculum baratangense AMV1 TaxID=631454 RepID=V4RKA4_9HYPH|nr:DMT family transporter [Lutibaculum baratangense]ESR26471.1 Permease of the drug/metabolite transporter (DMT) superfamily [Lutibaculum baratangense AMV1]